MPLTLLYSYAVKPPPPVILITAGDDQQIACAATIFLTAVVDIPSNLPGHTLEWEQTSGTTVILSCTDCLATSFSSVDQTNKTFRFWLDRNKPYEQYDDVAIDYTPTSAAPMQGHQASPNSNAFIKQTPYDIVVCESILVSGNPPPPELESTDVPASVILVWDEPTADGLESYITLYTVYENDINVSENQPNDLSYEGAIPAVYKIQTDFFVNGQPSTSTSCERDFLNDLPYPSLVVIDDLSPSQSHIADPTVTVVKYSNIGIFDSISDEPAQSHIADPELTLVRYANIGIFDPLSVSPKQSHVASPVVNITRFDSGGIGG